ncbi:hypothetical protein ACHAQI_009752 [Fusarium lateritium]
MPKTSTKSPPSHWRPGPYGAFFPRSRWGTSSSLPTTPSNGENHPLQNAQVLAAQPRPKAFQLPLAITTPSFEVPANCTEVPTTTVTSSNAIPPPTSDPLAVKTPQFQASHGLPGRPSFTREFVPYVPKPKPTPTPKFEIKPETKPETKPEIKPRSDLTMVDSMALKAVSRHGNSTQQPPGLAIHSNSSGGGVQFNVFTKVPTVSKTIAFNVENEEALLQAYRHVKAMNPSADVGGIMFCVAPKGGSFSTTQDIDWSSLAGRPDRSGHNNNINVPRTHSQYYRPSPCESPILFLFNWPTC